MKWLSEEIVRSNDSLERRSLDSVSFPIAYEVVGFRGEPSEKALWAVCEQEPDAGEQGTRVRLYVKLDCGF